MLSAGVTALVAIVVVVDAFVRFGVAASVWIGPVGLVAWLICVPLGASSLRVDDGGVRVQNGARVWDVPWGAVAKLRWDYQLHIDLVDGRTVVPWGGPEAKRRRPLRDQNANHTPKGSVLLDDFTQIRERALGEARLDSGGVEAPATRWSFPLLAVGGVLALASFASLFALII